MSSTFDGGQFNKSCHQSDRKANCAQELNQDDQNDGSCGNARTEDMARSK